MTLDEVKSAVEARTGVPADLLTGETIEENIARAKAILAYKRGCEQQRPKTTAEQFTRWMQETRGEESTDEATLALTALEEDLAEYPIIRDSGTPYANGVGIPDHRSTKEQFADFMAAQLAFDPKKKDGWRPLGG